MIDPADATAIDATDATDATDAPAGHFSYERVLYCFHDTAIPYPELSSSHQLDTRILLCEIKLFPGISRSPEFPGAGVFLESIESRIRKKGSIMLKKEMTDALNAQINLEFYSSNLYLQMCAWCEAKGMEGTAAFLKNHAAEEMSHMDRFFSFLNETGEMAILGTIAEPPTSFDSVKEMFEQVLKHEQLVTSKINDLAALAFDLKDFTTFNFLQYFIAEQLEEEALFKSILDKIELIGAPNKGLYFFDKELSKMDADHHGAPAPPAE